MGTRGEVYVRNSSSVIELWRHYDTYAEYMVPYFKDFARYAAWCAGSQRHWLTYPENVAAMLIAYDHELVLASHLRFARTGLCEAVPDLRPRGFTVEAESEDEAHSKAEEAILRAMEKGEFSVKVEQAE